MKPLLSLHMIVRNEARSIERVLLSARPFINTWDILDTGSTDGTQEIIQRVLVDVPGRLHEETIVQFEDTGIIDFGATRQRSLDLAEPNAEWTFWLSGDEYLQGGEKLVEFCRTHLDDPSAAYPGVVMYDELRVERHPLFRRGSGARWVDPIHEWINSPRCGERLPESIFVLHTGANHLERRQRFERDLIVLQKLRLRDPHSTRYAYYLAQTLECLNLHERAADAYQMRVNMGGWEDETYSAMWIGARELASAGNWDGALNRLLEAHRFKPKRAEALFIIADHFAKLDDHANACLFAAPIIDMDIPESSHLVQRDIYTHRALEILAIHAWYCGQKKLGKRAAEKLVDLFPANELHKKNLSFYSGKRIVNIGKALVTLRTDRFGDEEIFREIIEHDDYRLASMDLRHAVVIDAGCQIGIFSAAICDRFPMARVVGIEMDEDNASMAEKNLGVLGIRAMVVRGTLIGTRMPKGYLVHKNNAGAHAVVFDGNVTHPIKNPVTLAEVVSVFNDRRIGLLKMDIESAEHDVLSMAAKDGTLTKIDRIAMEWHAWRAWLGETAESIEKLLRSVGFVVEVVHGKLPSQGLIFAKTPHAIEMDREQERSHLALLLSA